MTWIKCAERMPKDMQRVLITGPDADRPGVKTNFVDPHKWSQAVAYWYGPSYLSDPPVTWVLDATGDGVDIHPTHWQPLPEPPNE